MTTEDRYNDFIHQCVESSFRLEKDVNIWLQKNGFFEAPASTKYHGAYAGGLYDHSRQVYLRLVELTKSNNLKWERPQSPFIIGMFHDLCKCDQYTFIENEYVGEPGHYEYNTNTLLKGHGSKSVMLLSQLMTLTEEEMLCIRYHMGAYGNEQEQKTEWAGFDAAVRKTNGLCLWVHQADQLASKIDNI